MRRQHPRTFLLLLPLLLWLSGCGEDNGLSPLTQSEDLSVLSEQSISLDGISADEAGDPGCVNPDDARALHQQAQEALRQAREALQAGNREEAMRLLERARHLLFQALVACRGEAVVTELAERVDGLLAKVGELLAGTPDERAQRLFERATHLRQEAQTALEGGRLEAAFHLLMQAQGYAFRALVFLNPQGVASHFKDQASRLIAQAEAAVAAHPSDRAQHYLDRARRAFDEGLEKFNQGEFRQAIHYFERAIYAARAALRIANRGGRGG